MLQRLRDYVQPVLGIVFGDDIFISYSRADGITYAEGLAADLAARGFSCRVDLLETQPGEELPDSLKRAVSDSKMLVVVGSDGACRSAHVAMEIEEFGRTRRMMIPIDFEGSIGGARWFALMRGLPTIAELTAALVTGRPSPGVISRIENSARFTRRNRRLRRLTWLSLATFVVLATLSAFAVRRSVNALQDAAAARRDVAAATSDAERARTAANEQTAVAERAKRDASEAAGKEALARSEAARQQQLADFARASGQLEGEGAGVVRQFDAGSGELDALRSAIAMGERLQSMVRPGQGVAQYPAVTPLVALNRVLFEIRERARLDTHGTKLRGIAVSPSGEIAVLEGDGNVTGDTTVRLWSAEGRALASWALAKGGTGAAVFTTDGRHLVVKAASAIQSWNLDGTLDRQWPGASAFSEARGGKLRMIVQGSTASVFDDEWRPVASVRGGATARIHPTRDLILTTGMRAITQIDFAGRAERFFEPQFGSLRELHFGVDGRTVIAAYADGSTYAIDLDKRQTRYSWDTLRDRTGPRLSPAEPLLATVGGDGAVRVWDYEGRLRAHFYGVRGDVLDVAFSHDGGQLVTTANDGTISIWTKQGRPVAMLRGHQGPVSTVTFVPRTKRLLSAGADDTVRIWDVGDRTRDISNRQLPPIGGIAADGSARTVVLLHGDAVRVRGPNGELVRSWQFPEGHYGTDLLTSVEGNPRFLLSEHNTTTLPILWSATGEKVGSLTSSHSGTIQSFVSIVGAAIDKNATRLLILRPLARVELHNLATGVRIDIPSGRGWGTAHAAGFDPLRPRVAIAWADGRIRFYTFSGQLQATIDTGQHETWSLAFSPDGTRLAAGGGDATVRLFNQHGTQTAILFGHSERIQSLCFSRDGQMIAAVATTGTARVWDINGRLVAEVSMPTLVRSEYATQDYGYSFPAAFTADSRALMIGGDDGIMRSWPVSDLPALLTLGRAWLQQ